MPALYRVNFTAATNEDLRHAFKLADSAGNALDLTGSTLSLAFEDGTGIGTLTASTANGRILVSVPSTGEFEIAVPASVMQSQKPGVYRHDLLLTQSDGRKQRVFEGTMTLARGVA